MRDLVAGVEGMGGFRVAVVVVAGGLRVEDGVLGLLVAGAVREAVGGDAIFLGGARTGVVVVVVVVVFGLVSPPGPPERASEAAVGAYSLERLVLGVFALGVAGTAGAGIP